MKKVMSLSVNGRLHDVAAPGSALLLEVLRDSLALTGTKQGCDGGECGACTVLVDGQPRLSCITLAASVEETIELIIELAVQPAQRHEAGHRLALLLLRPGLVREDRRVGAGGHDPVGTGAHPTGGS